MAYRRNPTPEQTARVCSYIRSGAYSLTAIEAVGIPAEEFARWLERSREPNATKAIRDFAAEVRKAAAQARILAETHVYENDKKLWLRNGPGREQPGRPGWTTTAPPQKTRADAGNALEDPAWGQAVGKMLDAMKDFPDARAVLAEALNRTNGSGKKIGDVRHFRVEPGARRS